MWFLENENASALLQGRRRNKLSWYHPTSPDRFVFCPIPALALSPTAKTCYSVRFCCLFLACLGLGQIQADVRALIRSVTWIMRLRLLLVHRSGSKASSQSPSTGSHQPPALFRMYLCYCSSSQPLQFIFLCILKRAGQSVNCFVFQGFCLEISNSRLWLQIFSRSVLPTLPQETLLNSAHSYRRTFSARRFLQRSGRVCTLPVRRSRGCGAVLLFLR